MPIKVRPPPDWRGRGEIIGMSARMRFLEEPTRELSPLPRYTNPNVAIDDGIYDSCDCSLQSYSQVLSYLVVSETELSCGITLQANGGLMFSSCIEQPDASFVGGQHAQQYIRYERGRRISYFLRIDISALLCIPEQLLVSSYPSHDTKKLKTIFNQPCCSL
mgnify:CR=1 FL=1